MEQIEQAFIPPDITKDMYEYDYDGDEEWNTFLNTLTQTLPQDAIVEDDPEADPEYNILADHGFELCKLVKKSILLIYFDWPSIF